MKKSYFLIFSTLIFSNLFASNNLIQEYINQHKISQKIYINYKDLNLNETGIYLIYNNSYIPIIDLSFDEKGFYTKKTFKNYKKMKENETPEIWQCNDCGRIFVPSIWDGYKCPDCGSRNAKPVNM